MLGKHNGNFLRNSRLNLFYKKKLSIKFLLIVDKQNFTHIINTINKRIIATIAHCKPITTKPDDINITISISKVNINKIKKMK